MAERRYRPDGDAAPEWLAALTSSGTLNSHAAPETPVAPVSHAAPTSPAAPTYSVPTSPAPTAPPSWPTSPAAPSTSFPASPPGGTPVSATQPPAETTPSQPLITYAEVVALGQNVDRGRDQLAKLANTQKVEVAILDNALTQQHILVRENPDLSPRQQAGVLHRALMKEGPRPFESIAPGEGEWAIMTQQAAQQRLVELNRLQQRYEKLTALHQRSLEARAHKTADKMGKTLRGLFGSVDQRFAPPGKHVRVDYLRQFFTALDKNDLFAKHLANQVRSHHRQQGWTIGVLGAMVAGGLLLVAAIPAVTLLAVAWPAGIVAAVGASVGIVKGGIVPAFRWRRLRSQMQTFDNALGINETKTRSGSLWLEKVLQPLRNSTRDLHYEPSVVSSRFESQDQFRSLLVISTLDRQSLRQGLEDRQRTEYANKFNEVVGPLSAWVASVTQTIVTPKGSSVDVDEARKAIAERLLSAPDFRTGLKDLAESGGRTSVRGEEFGFNLVGRDMVNATLHALDNPPLPVNTVTASPTSPGRPSAAGRGGSHGAGL
jgi:hypothetical protein